MKNSIMRAFMFVSALLGVHVQASMPDINDAQVQHIVTNKVITDTLQSYKPIASVFGSRIVVGHALPKLVSCFFRKPAHKQLARVYGKIIGAGLTGGYLLSKMHEDYMGAYTYVQSMQSRREAFREVAHKPADPQLIKDLFNDDVSMQKAIEFRTNIQDKEKRASEISAYLQSKGIDIPSENIWFVPQGKSSVVVNSGSTKVLLLEDCNDVVQQKAVALHEACHYTQNHSRQRFIQKYAYAGLAGLAYWPVAVAATIMGPYLQACRNHAQEVEADSWVEKHGGKQELLSSAEFFNKKPGTVDIINQHPNAAIRFCGIFSDPHPTSKQRAAYFQNALCKKVLE